MAVKGFTEKAREAARVKRAERSQDLRQNFGVPEVFVVRDGAGAFTYEIRRFGAILLSKGTGIYQTAEAARNAGEKVLRTTKADQPSSASTDVGPAPSP